MKSETVDYVEQLRAWTKTESRELPIEEICETLDAYDTLKSKLAEVEEQLVEAKMATDFANAACDLKDKRLDEYEAVLAWASENVSSCLREPFRPNEWNAYVFHSEQRHTASTFYEALRSAWEGREK